MKRLLLIILITLSYNSKAMEGLSTSQLESRLATEKNPAIKIKIQRELASRLGEEAEEPQVEKQKPRIPPSTKVPTGQKAEAKRQSIELEKQRQAAAAREKARAIAEANKRKLPSGKKGAPKGEEEEGRAALDRAARAALDAYKQTLQAVQDRGDVDWIGENFARITGEFQF